MKLVLLMHIDLQNTRAETFKLKVADSPHFEKLKTCNISTKYSTILPKFCTMMHLRPLNPISQ